MHSADKQLNQIQMNILITSVAVGLGFIFCWSWTSVTYMLVQLGLPSPDYYFIQFTVIMTLVSVCLNAVIYTVNLHEFQMGVRSMKIKLSTLLRFAALNNQ